MIEQDFEIISLYNDDHVERMKAIDHVDDFSTLEEIFITDNYLNVQAKAYDKLCDLYDDTKKFRKFKKLAKSCGFLGWIPFIIDDLRNNTNIERTIQYIVHKYDTENGNNVINSIIQVMLKPRTYDNHPDIVSRMSDYGIQYQYKMVVKILTKIEDRLVIHYNFAMCWNSRIDSHIRFYNEKCYDQVEC